MSTAKNSNDRVDTIIDPQVLRGHLTALANEHRSNGDTLRQAVLTLLKSLVQEAHTTVENQLFEHGSGTRCARTLSKFQDELLRALYDFTITHIYCSPNPTEGERLAIVAVGGYGRGTLAPYSDIDLLFLHPHKLTSWAESVIEYLLYMLWDLGYKVGHATRNVDHCIQMASTDHTIRTSILEARFLWGDKKLFNILIKRFDRELVARTVNQFIEIKLEERDQRHRQSGESRYLVEPNIKQGKGGLRDLHTLFWIGQYAYRTRKRTDLVEAGLFMRDEYERFEKAEDFLWAVRCHLHFETSRPEERLSFELQQELARRLGYSTRPGQKDVERFMRHYFLIAKDVGDLTRIVCAALEEKRIKRVPVLTRVLGTFGLGAATELDHSFIIERGRLNFNSPSLFDDDPTNLVRLFHYADLHATLLHPNLVQLASRSLDLITNDVRDDPEANHLFLEIVSSPRGPERTLRRMNEAGVLGRFIPEFGLIVAMTQFNRYHHFTVDEHLLRTVGIISELEHGRLSDVHPLSHKIFPTLENRRVLYVAAFMHDIAKGRPDDHSIAGAKIAKELCPRLGMTKSESETVSWLIEQHLVMSDVAQRRDLFDSKTISDFSALVQSPGRLKLLLMLTVADICAVGPGVWNGWKGELLRTLYLETEPSVSGGHSETGKAGRAQSARKEFKVAMSDWRQDQIEQHNKRLGDPYWLTTHLELQTAHARLIEKAEIKATIFNTSNNTSAFLDSTRLHIYMPDHTDLLTTISGACVISGADIVDALIFTTSDGWALDTVVLKRIFESADETRRAQRISDTIESVLRGDLRLPEAVENRTAPQEKDDLFDITPQIVISNSLSDHSTVIEIACLDRPGLLFDITQALREINLKIRSAHIATFGERAVDVFYVRDLFGHRIENKPRQNKIRALLNAAIDPKIPTRQAIRNVLMQPTGYEPTVS